MLPVWRLENAAGEGPYTAADGTGTHLMRLDHNRNGLYLGWRHVGLTACGWSKDWVAGCPSLFDLEGWFGSYLPDLKLAGYRVMRYTVPSDLVRMGTDNRQLAFIKGLVKGVECR